ncbi:VanZ family protein [Olivibacter sp. SDN3]|nr:VanZ family protein [Olivibacter sp. SDN3]
MGGATENIPVFEGIDKLVHTGFFFVFSVLLCFGFSSKNKTRNASWITVCIVAIISVAFGLLTEFLQYQFFTYRSGDWWDFFVDVVGTGMGVFSYLVLHRNYR